MSFHESSERLPISPKTVGTHVQRVHVKRDSHSRVEAVAYAYRADLPSRASGCYACGEI